MTILNALPVHLDSADGKASSGPETRESQHNHAQIELDVQSAETTKEQEEARRSSGLCTTPDCFSAQMLCLNPETHKAEDMSSQRAFVYEDSIKCPGAFFVPSSSPLLTSPPTMVYGISDNVQSSNEIQTKNESSMTVESSYRLDQPIVDAAGPLCHANIALQSPFHSQEEEDQKDDTIIISSSPPTVVEQEYLDISVAAPDAAANYSDDILLSATDAATSTPPESMIAQSCSGNPSTDESQSNPIHAATHMPILSPSYSSPQASDSPITETSECQKMPLNSNDGETSCNLAPKPSSTVTTPTSSRILADDLSTPSQSTIPQKRVIPDEDCTPPPSTKRMTVAAQKKQHQKLITPFRSPFMNKINTPQSATVPSHCSSTATSCRSEEKEDIFFTPPSKATKSQILPRSAPSLHSASPLPKSMQSKSLLKSSAKASAQFKSPFRSPLTTTGPPSTPLRSTFSSSNSATNSAQSRSNNALEGKVARLRRALKIKREGEAEKLEGLVKKWREAGREAAWNLWNIVQETGDSESSTGGWNGINSKAPSGGLDGGWGWANEKPGWGRNDNWGWDDSKHDGDGDEDDFVPDSPTKRENASVNFLNRQPAAHQDEEGQSVGVAGKRTLGTMLTQFGIMPETLGWDEEEGDFLDKTT